MGGQLALRRRPGWWLTVACAVVVLVLSLVACGGGDSDSGVASARDDPSSSDDDSGDDASGGGSADDGSADETEEELLDWVECMRGEGVDVPDPQVDADGNLTLGGGLGGGRGGVDPQDFEKASAVCGEIPQGAFGGDRPDEAEVQDMLLEFAQCMRENGYDMPDPDFSGEGGLTSAFGDIDTNDPAFQEASAACEDIFAEGLGGGDDSSGEG